MIDIDLQVERVMGCCQSAEPSAFSRISDDSLTKCFSFMNPIDFISIRLTCNHFKTLTNASRKSVQEYWKHQCLFICDDVSGAIQCNNFNTQNWFDFYVELQQLIVYLTKYI